MYILSVFLQKKGCKSRLRQRKREVGTDICFEAWELGTVIY